MYVEVLDSLVNTFKVDSGVVAGRIYKFRARAKNKYGDGPYSSVLSYVAASAPSMPSAAPTISNVGSKVRIKWSLPNARGKEIT